MGRLKNLFGSSKEFFDKEATIKEYFAIVPPYQRKKCETYDELYEEALKYVNKQDFEENTKDQINYFHELTSDEGIIATTIGVIGYIVAREVDVKGKSIEEAINSKLPNNYDTNNPFDVKDGRGHRIFGHDIFTFALKNIPADTIIKVNNKAIRIGDFLGVGIDGYVSMWDLILKFYGNDGGVMNCLKHTVIHFAKDIFTPDGLPLPFTSFFNEYVHLDNFHGDGNVGASVLKYKDSFMSKYSKLRMQMKASDFASFIIIQILTEMYVATKKNSVENDGEDLRQDIKLIAMGTCISLQMATIILDDKFQIRNKKIGDGMIPGGKINLLLMGDFFNITMKEMKSIITARNNINKKYHTNYMEGYYEE